MLNDADLPAELWAEAVGTANYIRCRSPTANRLKTPWELFYNMKPDVSRLRTFGATAYVYIPKEKRHKLDDHSTRGIMVGYAANTKGYRVLLEDDSVVIGRDVIFDEGVGAGRRNQQEQEDSDSELEIEDIAEPEDMDTEEPPGANVRRSNRRAQPAGEWWRSTRPRYEDANANARAAARNRPDAAAAMSAVCLEPTTFEEAVASPEAEQWQQAMDEEFASLMENETWTLEELPPGVKPIPVKWVFKLKTASNGGIERYKARLVAKGFAQREGIDYDEVFAPVSKYATLRTLLAFVAADDLELHQLDIKTAFLNGDIDEDIYLKQPPGYEEGTSNLVCHLRRALYGLRQAPRQWHARLKKELEGLGFTESEADPGLFIYNDKHDTIYLLVYVDDLLVAAKELSSVEWAKCKIKDTFDARDMGEAEVYLGMLIKRDRANLSLKLSQEKMTTQLLSKHQLLDAKPKSVPISTSIKLSKDEGEPLNKEKYGYSQLVGSLMYLAVCTRPDIAQAVGALAKYMAAPTVIHWAAATGVLRYLAGTKDYGINFGREGCNTELVGYCDSDYAGDLDTRRSTTGYVFVINGGAITWSSRRQQTVAASTTEAEYMAAAAATKEALWLRKLINDFQKPVSTVTIQADNQGAIKLLKNPITSLRSKHIDVIYHFARERVMRKEVEFKYVKTELMIADNLTKSVSEGKHTFCREGMGVSN